MYCAAVAQHNHSMSDPTEWQEDDPKASGWYAVMQGWDAAEGFFPGARLWDGDHWDKTTTAGVVRYAGPFDDEAAALAWADAHDPDL